MSWDIFSKSKIQYFLQKLKDKFVQKETGKGLSTNDFTNEDKALIGQTLGNNTVLTTDKTPFLTRQTLNPTGFSGYVREKLVGASYAWNQLFVDGNLTDATNWGCSGGTFTISGNVATITCTTAGNVIFAPAQNISTLVNHKYYACVTIKSTNGKQITLQTPYTSGTEPTTTSTSFTKLETIGYRSSDYTGKFPRIVGFSMAVGEKFEVKCFMLVDLTLAFGSTVADYLYSLANNGGITKLHDMGFPIDKYTPYGYGLYSVKTSGKKIVGFNVWDEEWRLGKYNQSTGAYTSDDSQICNVNKIKVLGGKTYYASVPTNKRFDYYEYDANDNFIKFTATLGGTFTLGENTAYINFTMGSAYGTTYNNDICINISDTNKNGQYEPYSSTTYPLGNDELRGKFDLVNGEIVASGDIKESNGGITRYIKRIELNSLTYTYDSSYQRFSAAITDLKVGGARSLKMVCSKYECKSGAETFDSSWDKVVYNVADPGIYIHDHSYTDPTTFKNSLAGVYLEYPLATPTTEQSTPFADPMSMVGATTEEYIDTRDIPCPVGAERQYMGQSEDVIEIPSSPQSDGERYLKSIISGGKQQLVWDENNMPFIPFIGNLIGNTFSALFYPANGATSFKLKVTPKGSTNTSMSCIIFSRYTVTAVTVAANSSNKIVQNQSAINMLVYGQSGSITLDFDTNNDYALIIGNSIYDSWCVIGFIRGGNNTFVFETIV